MLKTLWTPAGVVVLLAVFGCGAGDSGSSDGPELPEQPDRWVDLVTLDDDTEVKFVGRTREFLITSVGKVKKVGTPTSIRVGESIEGLQVGAIRCSFFTRDAKYGGDRFAWRGRWYCMAGRSRSEVENASQPGGDKRHDYIYVAPVDL
jgi:hypothetical protein